MKQVEVDLLRKTYDLPPSSSPQRKRFVFVKRFLLFILVFGATTGIAFSYHVKDGNELNSFPRLSLFSTISHFVQSKDRPLKGERDERVNMLLMGVGGSGHDGPQLSDTMIFASIQPDTGDIGMISIPRDLIVPIPDYGWRKINHANAYGEQDKTGYGPDLASQVVEEVLGQPIHYHVRVDFNGFAELIDSIGGIEVAVENSFSDFQYPSHGKAYAECGTVETIINEEGESEEVPSYDCRFETISFQKGWTQMDGDTALKFVRSRHGTNGESSDFARSKRQQQVLKAVKDKVFSASTFLNPSKINRIKDTLEGNIATNISTWELLRFASMAKSLNTDNISHHVLDASPESPLYATNLNGAYVLLPKNDDWGLVQNLAENIFESNTNIASTSSGDEKPRFIRVEIQNGTSISGLAFRTSQVLKSQGFDVVKIGNAQTKGYKNTVVYDLTNGRKATDLKTLKELLEADVTLSATGWLLSGDIIPRELSIRPDAFEDLATEENVDFIVILGEHGANVALGR